MRRKAIISIIATVVVFSVVVLFILNYFNLLPKKTYTAEDFNIETIISKHE